jgi:hypothetical protein
MCAATIGVYEEILFPEFVRGVPTNPEGVDEVVA